MTATINYNFPGTLSVNASNAFVWQLKTNGTPENITGYTFKMEIRNQPSKSGVLLATLESPDSIEIVDAVNGIFRVIIPPMPLVESKGTQIFFDLVVTQSGTAFTRIRGQGVADPGITF